MARNGKDIRSKNGSGRERESLTSQIHPDIRKSVLVVVFLALTIVFILAAAGKAGPLGDLLYRGLHKLFGVGYYLFPAGSFISAFAFLAPERKIFLGLTLLGFLFFVVSGLGFIDIVSPGSGGLTGNLIGTLEIPFGTPASIVITLAILIASFLVILNRPLKLSLRLGNLFHSGTAADSLLVNAPILPPEAEKAAEEEEKPAEKKKGDNLTVKTAEPFLAAVVPKAIKNYTPPPLGLLNSASDKPTIGDLRANANIIKRTLDSFGIPVEMGEINVGPTVTRYTLKPAEGVKLSRLTALGQDLALALAAHPIRIEAPIPGKSFVGIEVPNRVAAIVRLGTLLPYPEFQKSGPLTFVLGRNVSGEPVFADIDRMPHLLVAGATGSGKSIMIHSLIISLLYKNSPEMLRLIMIDPKRVELSTYDGIPHLLAPVITKNKEAIGALRWAIQEMDRRYEVFLGAGARDIRSYNKSAGDKLPYILIVIDELADLMTTYGKEVEGSIIRLAQMARATGLHLVVSTQRPSVEVITGLIKANITSRVALQVASQVDSRTILDAAGAEKLLGHGDLLFVSAEFSKPHRLQGAYLTEEEVRQVVKFIKDNNESREVEESLEKAEQTENGNLPSLNFDDYAGDEDDELYNEAVVLVKSAKKASASLLQRRLSVGYARAARLLDIMEERGVVGPADGAKPREVYE